jgi:hypothetical protein
MHFYKSTALILLTNLLPLFIFSQELKKDSSARNIPNKPRPYKDVITSSAISETGFITTHKIEERYYFEIPDSSFARDIMVVNRISQGAADTHSGGTAGFAGDQIGDNVIRFQKGPNNKIFIRSILFNDRASDSGDNGMYRSVSKSNIQPIVASFDIKAVSPSGKSYVIDMTDYLNNDNSLFFFEPIVKSKLLLGAIQADKSFIESIKSYPINVQIHTVKTFVKANVNSFATLGLVSSLILLPEKALSPRYYDERIGYFFDSYTDYDLNPQGVKVNNIICRWRLEPREEDMEKYRQGILVQPKKPIVFYIDPTTPKKWVPYLIQGVNDWQKAFEKAGFKNAIYAREAPGKAEDSSWSIEDARYSAIVYKPSNLQNASGPNIHDPRTGEILESHVNWYHNVMQVLHDWYFVQAAAIDPKARKMLFDDSLMGQLIRFVSSHEIGHTLGLRHNFGASAAVPVDSLRSKNWVEKNGICPSIMDYARFNYVAQPEDNISEKGIFPRIGVYDEWAIEWGYRFFSHFKTEEDEKAFLNKWIVEKLHSDKRLWFGSENSASDPRCQAEDLGDDAMSASYFGIKNLKVIMAHLVEWTSEPGKNYDDLEKMYGALLDQYFRYLFHVVRYMGARYNTPSTSDQGEPVWKFIDSIKQKKAIEFLQSQLFVTPEWIKTGNDKLYSLKGGRGPFDILFLQQDVLNALLSQEQYSVMMRAEASQKNAYTFYQMLKDLEKGIFNEINGNGTIDLYRRNLQKAYVTRVISLLTMPHQNNVKPNAVFYNVNTDILPIVKEHLKTMLAEINKSVMIRGNNTTRFHLLEIQDRIKKALNPAFNTTMPDAPPKQSISIMDQGWNRQIFNY